MLPLLWLAGAAWAGTVEIALAPGSHAEAFELTCADGFRNRTAFAGGRARMAGVPSDQPCTVIFKGGAPGRWQGVAAGDVLTCEIGADRVSCTKGAAPASAPAAPPPGPVQLRSPARAAPRGLTVRIEGAAFSAARLECADGWSRALPAERSTVSLPASGIENCELVVIPEAPAAVPAPAGADLRCTLEPARLRCGG